MPRDLRPRDESIDLLRGAAMVLMALDHTRDFFGGQLGDPTDLATTSYPLFFTRWITHFCAPIFVFLAGTAAALSGTRRTRRELSVFLLTRGVWLVVLELTLVRFAWSFDSHFQRLTLQVIWVIGASMVVLSGLVFLPRAVIGAIGVALIGLHDLFDHVNWHQAAWTLLHVPGLLRPAGGIRLFVLYPLIPWIGVMAVGYAIGPMRELRPETRRRRLALAGAAITLFFVLLRASNVYGDPSVWRHQTRSGFTFLSFLDCTKYPPSLLFLTMTLGPAFLAWAALTRGTPHWGRPLLTFGRVPLFFYVLHLYVIHGAATLVGLARHAPHPTRWGSAGFGLAGVYAVWLGLVLMLYPACRWFAGVKSRRTDAWLSYV